MRKQEVSSDVHFFSTQFFQKIQDQGVESVQNWTKRRKIDVFEKKFIFIPINDHLHWSLCVVVNPGRIENAFNQDDDYEENETTKLDAPFLLFLDSLKFHEQSKVKNNIYEWLNFEAKRVNRFQDLRRDEPFWERTLPIFTPKGEIIQDDIGFVVFNIQILIAHFLSTVPYQDNGWDCGVFVCRYAFSVLSMRSIEFKFTPSSENYYEKRKKLQKEWSKLIDNSEAFNFDVADIRRLRKEFATLIDNLSDMYKDKERERKIKKQIIMANLEKKIGTETSNKGGEFL